MTSLPPASKVSSAFRAANPHLYGPDLPTPDSKLPKPERATGPEKGKPDSLCPKLERRATTSTVGAKEAKTGNHGRVLVRVTSIRRRLLDEDNLCEKYVVDCCRYAGLLPEDSPSRTKIEVAQRKAAKGEPEATLVEIFQPTP